MFRESIVFFRVPSYGWISIISVSVHTDVLYNFFYQIHITGISTSTVMFPDTSSGFTHHRSAGTNILSLERCHLDQMPCHTHGGLDTYNCLPVTVSSHYSIHQKLLYIHASYYYRRPRAEMCLGLIELTWLVFPSLHTSKCYEIPQCVSTE